MSDKNQPILSPMMVDLLSTAKAPSLPISPLRIRGSAAGDIDPGSFAGEINKLHTRVEKAEVEADSAKSELYAIVNAAGADCIRKFVGEEKADGIIKAERERITAFRTRMQVAEARVKELEAAIAQTLQLCESSAPAVVDPQTALSLYRVALDHLRDASSLAS